VEDYRFSSYELRKRSGAETPPQTNLLTKRSRPSNAELLALPGEKMVLKIVSPTIIYKTEVGGMKVVKKRPEKIRSAWRRMMVEVPKNYAALIQHNPEYATPAYRDLTGNHPHGITGKKTHGIGDIFRFGQYFQRDGLFCRSQDIR